jgi:hypothetical protein
MTLSNQTIQDLAKELEPEVYKHILKDDRLKEIMNQYVEMMNQVISDSIQEKLGPIDPMIKEQLGSTIYDRMIMQ